MNLQSNAWKLPLSTLKEGTKPQSSTVGNLNLGKDTAEKLVPAQITSKTLSFPERKERKEKLGRKTGKFSESIIQQKQDNSSSAFSSSSSYQNSSQDSQNQNPVSKVKKVFKKSERNGNYRKYSRITPQVKERLIYLIARQNMSIKQASVKLKINYSSAKFIFSQYRDRKLQIIDRDTDRGQVTNDVAILQQTKQNENQAVNNQMKLLVKCSSGGKFQAQSQKTYVLREILQLYTQLPYIQAEKLKLEF